MKVYIVYAAQCSGDEMYPHKLFHTEEDAKHWVETQETDPDRYYYYFDIEEWEVE